MNLDAIYAVIFRFWRQWRMDQFEKLIQPTKQDRILDVGGRPGTWTTRPQMVHQIDCVNVEQSDYQADANPGYSITVAYGDGCHLQFADQAYDILFSNSVIEHVGDWDRQCDFAREVRRVGCRLWVQTPAYGCPIEPHFLAPAVHWLPVSLRRHVVRWLTPWGWIQKPSQAEADEAIAFTQLLTKRQFQQLFPDCEILTERLLGVFPKSYVAYRTQFADVTNRPVRNDQIAAVPTL